MSKCKAHALFDNVSFADYLQMCAATAILLSGGPRDILVKSFMYFITYWYSWGRKDATKDVEDDVTYETNNEAYEQWMKSLGFTTEEIAALGVIDSFGIIDTISSKEYRLCRFTNDYYKNLITFGKASKDLELPGDKLLLKDEYKEHVKKFADDQKEFFNVFQTAFVKTSKIGCDPKTLGGIEDFFNCFDIRNP